MCGADDPTQTDDPVKVGHREQASSPHGEYQRWFCLRLFKQEASHICITIQDPQAKYINVMSIPWSGMGTVYAFSPFKMLPAVLTKIHQFQNLTAPWMSDLSEKSSVTSYSSRTPWSASTNTRHDQEEASRLVTTDPQAYTHGVVTKTGHSETARDFMMNWWRPSSQHVCNEPAKTGSFRYLYGPVV